MSSRYTVTWQEYREAENNWYKLYDSRANFLTFLGDWQGEIKTTDQGFTIIYRVPELMYQKIQILKSPHYRTLMRAFIIRTGYHRKDFK